MLKLVHWLVANSVSQLFGAGKAENNSMRVNQNSQVVGSTTKHWAQNGGTADLGKTFW